MPADGADATEVDILFSSSSSFSSVSPLSDNDSGVRRSAHRPPEPPHSTAVELIGDAASDGGSSSARPYHVDPPALLHDAAVYVRSPIARPLSPPTSQLPPGSDSRVRDSAASDWERRSVSALRDSAAPPDSSTLFCSGVAVHAAPAVRASTPLEWEAESVEEFRCRPSAGAADASPSVSLSSSTTPSPSHVAAKVRRESSPPLEFRIVNAERAREAHALLTSFSAVTIARYRLVKLTVAQRLYRIYYTKWLARLSQDSATTTRAAPATPPPPQWRCSRVTQTDVVRQRSVSAGTEFADIDSFHASRSASRGADSPRVHAAQPSPPRAETPRGERRASASSAPPPVLATLHAHAVSLPSASAGDAADGIAVRTKPAQLVDFGHHSEAPQRKTRRDASGPAVELPAVVPSPERIFRF
ncbi:hypothetical protein NESM_000706600 [Novymonas esmeraldas]|uniref:Uncharacterized protein n=1 Tax=Novymonas esmeraldas TaxID=1808958 RepID=A0AAW0EXG7_9TRYP